MSSPRLCIAPGVGVRGPRDKTSTREKDFPPFKRSMYNSARSIKTGRPCLAGTCLLWRRLPGCDEGESQSPMKQERSDSEGKPNHTRQDHYCLEQESWGRLLLLMCIYCHVLFYMPLSPQYEKSSLLELPCLWSRVHGEMTKNRYFRCQCKSI